MDFFADTADVTELRLLHGLGFWTASPPIPALSPKAAARSKR